MEFVFSRESINYILNNNRKVLSFNGTNVPNTAIEHLFTRVDANQYNIEIYLYNIPDDEAFDFVKNLPCKIAKGSFKVEEPENPDSDVKIDYQFFYNWITGQVLSFVKSTDDLVTFYQKILDSAYDLEDEDE